MAAARDELFAEAGALSADEVAVHAPLAVLTGEAVDVAAFAKRYWKPAVDDATGRITRPGLSFAGPKLPETISDEILTLGRMVGDAQCDYTLAAEPTTDSPMPRAELAQSQGRCSCQGKHTDQLSWRTPGARAGRKGDTDTNWRSRAQCLTTWPSRHILQRLKRAQPSATR